MKSSVLGSPSPASSQDIISASQTSASGVLTGKEITQAVPTRPMIPQPNPPNQTTKSLADRTVGIAFTRDPSLIKGVKGKELLVKKFLADKVVLANDNREYKLFRSPDGDLKGELLGALKGGAPRRGASASNNQAQSSELSNRAASTYFGNSGITGNLHPGDYLETPGLSSCVGIAVQQQGFGDTQPTFLIHADGGEVVDSTTGKNYINGILDRAISQIGSSLNLHLAAAGGFVTYDDDEDDYNRFKNMLTECCQEKGIALNSNNVTVPALDLGDDGTDEGDSITMKVGRNLNVDTTHMGPA